LKSNQPIDRAWDISYATPLKIRELLDGHSGALSGTLHAHPTPSSAGDALYSDSDSDDIPWTQNVRHRDFFAEVTPFEVHAKLGAYNTLVWVTSLDKGLPVANARVRLYRDNYRGLTDGKPVLAEAITDKNGIAMLAGRIFLEHVAAPRLNPADAFMVRIDAGKEMALL